MKIMAVQAFTHAAPTGDMRGDGRNYCYVKVETDDGRFGWGEATCGSASVAMMVEELGRYILGEDPLRTELLWQRMYNCQHNIRGGIIHMAALSGIDVALWDLKGKALGAPVYQLLGGATRDRLWSYGRFDGATPEAAAVHARREVARGFTALKGDPFTHRGPHLTAEALDAAVATVAAVREAVGPEVEILVEAHGRLSCDSAARFLAQIGPYRPMFVEEPLAPEDMEGLARLAQLSPVPLAAGERLLGKWAFAPLLERRLVAVAQPDPAHVGGITELRKIAALAEAHHVWIQPHNPYGPVNTLAAAHLNAVLPNFLIMELIMERGMHDWFAQVTGHPFPAPVEGHFPLPTGVGLGVEIDEAALARLPAAPESHPSSYLRHARLDSPQLNSWS
jgi:galactonate dehydratase